MSSAAVEAAKQSSTQLNHERNTTQFVLPLTFQYYYSLSLRPESMLMLQIIFVLFTSQYFITLYKQIGLKYEGVMFCLELLFEAIS